MFCYRLIFIVKNTRFIYKKEDDMDNLPELRDIHIPEDVSMFPLAHGWWAIMLSIVLLFIVYRVIVTFIKTSRKRYAKNLLKKIDTQNVVTAAAEISNILRRICVYKFPKAQSLSGKEWIDFLSQNCKITLSEKSADLLVNAPYIKKDSKEYSQSNLKSLMMFANRFIGENL